jgi:hypothetical protein
MDKVIKLVFVKLLQAILIVGMWLCIGIYILAILDKAYLFLLDARSCL